MRPPTPHDTFFKATFSDPEHASGLIRRLVGRSLAARFDWSTLRLCAGSFVDAALRGRHSDLLFTVRCGEKEVLVYLLLEHQSTSDPLMPYRLLVYLVRIWEKLVRERPGITHLPAILPLVIHHSRDGWTSPTSFTKLLDLPPEVLPALAPHIPSFEFLLDDLHAASDASLRRRAMTALGRLSLFCLRHAPEPDQLVRRLARWATLVHEVHRAPGGREALELLWRYIFTISAPERPEDLVEQLLLVVGEEGKEEIVTAAEQLMNRGREQGRREMLLDLLRSRFGTLAEAVEARVRAADSAQLQRWLPLVVNAPTLAEILVED